MAVTAKLYGKAPANFLGGESSGDTFAVDWISDTIKVALASSSYTPNQDTHETYADITNELSTAGGYTSGGATLGSRTVSYNSTGNVTTFDGADVSWTSASFTARYAIIYKSGGGNPLVGYVDFGADQTVTSGTFQIIWDAAGIFTATVA